MIKVKVKTSHGPNRTRTLFHFSRGYMQGTSLKKLRKSFLDKVWKHKRVR